ncbi:MAG: malectin domain-containing carbohydrate-binding protein, partial [Bryobacteraceae bacterium]
MLSTLRSGAVMIASLLLAWASVGSAQTIRIRCGVAGSYTASDSTVWQGDQYSTGGVQLYTGYAVSSTPDPTLYRYARQGYYGDFSYNIPVTNGNYQLTLK